MKNNDPYCNDPFTKWRIDKIVSAIPKNSKVLDVGCGRWIRICRNLVENGCKVDGIDTYHPLKDRLRTFYRGNMHTVLPSLIKKKTRYNCVIFGNSLEYSVKPLQLLKLSHILLKNKGKIIISTPNLVSLPNRFRSIIGLTPSFYSIFEGGGKGHFWTFSELSKALRSVGFKKIRSLSQFKNIGKTIIVEGIK